MISNRSHVSRHPSLSPAFRSWPSLRARLRVRSSRAASRPPSFHSVSGSTSASVRRGESWMAAPAQQIVPSPPL
jgi:hypothetical protein